MYDFSGQILMPKVFIPLMKAPTSDPGRMTRLFDVVEELVRKGDERIVTFVRIEFCEPLLAHHDWYLRSWPFMGAATKTACANTADHWRRLRG
jgi:hypothetical protein